MYEYKGKLERIVDGDTLDVVIDVGFQMTTQQRIRLAYINAPETYRQSHDSEEYKKGMKSKEFIEKRMKENKGEFSIKTGKDKGVYGRYLGEIFFADSEVSLNNDMLEKGLAKKSKY